MTPSRVQWQSKTGNMFDSWRNGVLGDRNSGNAARALGFQRWWCRLSVNLQRPRWGFALWLAVVVATQQVDQRPLWAQDGLPSSSGTNTLAVDIGGNAASGSKSFALINGRLTFERLDSVYYELALSLHGQYGQSNGELISKNWGAEASFDATPQADFSLFSFTDLRQNPVRKLTLRSRMGAGAKWTLMRNSEKNETAFSAALLTAYEKYQTAGEEPGASTWRWSFRLKRVLSVASKTNLRSAWFIQPRVEILDDYLVEGYIEFSQQLTQRLELTFTFDYFYDSAPPVDIRNSERRYLFGVKGRF